jgi:uncharacterized protein (TIGR03000 family)
VVVVANGGAGGTASAIENRLKKVEDAIAALTAAVDKLNKGTASDGGATPPAATPPSGTKPGGNKPAPDNGVVSRVAPSSARITVKLPAQARLFVDNVECPLTSGNRSFLTPRLERGKRYYYTLRMEVVQNGQRVTQTRRVTLGAGDSIQVNFLVPATTNTVRR